MTFSLGKINL